MRLTVVGSGDAFNAQGRGHACYLLEGSDHPPVMVDFGATALLGLHRLGRTAVEVETFVFTHLHGDHIGGFPFLFIDSTYADRRTRPLSLVGPLGLEARVRALLDVTYGADIAGRPEAPELRFVELPPETTATVDGLQLETFPADHQDPPEAPLCLRFTAPDGVRVAFSGDTRICEGLLSAAQGVDLLVAECSGLAPPIGRHISWSEWAPVLPTLDARRVLLTHLGAGVRSAVPRLLEAYLERPTGAGLGAAPAPRLDFADDGLVLDLLPRAAVVP